MAFVSLPTTGQSLNQSALRIGGTLLAFVAGLFYLGLYPQDRWLFFLAFTPYLAFVTFKMTGKGGQYFWFVAAFVSMMIITAGPGSSEHAFNFAASRVVETLLGIAVWALVSTFIWPQSNRGTLETISRQLLETQAKLVGELKETLIGSGRGEVRRFVRDSASKLEMALAKAIGAAAAESYEVREVRHLWERLHACSLATLETLDRLQFSSADLRQADQNALPGMGTLLDEVGSRYSQAYQALGRSVPAPSCQAVALTHDEAAMGPRDHFHRAALEVARNELARLEMLSRDIVGSVRGLQGDDRKDSPASTAPERASITGPSGLAPLDADRIRATIMVVACMWFSVLIWIYLEPPGHLAWYQFAPALALWPPRFPRCASAFSRPWPTRTWRGWRCMSSSCRSTLHSGSSLW